MNYDDDPTPADTGKQRRRQTRDTAEPADGPAGSDRQPPPPTDDADRRRRSTEQWSAVMMINTKMRLSFFD